MFSIRNVPIVWSFHNHTFKLWQHWLFLCSFHRQLFLLFFPRPQSGQFDDLRLQTNSLCWGDSRTNHFAWSAGRGSLLGPCGCLHFAAEETLSKESATLHLLDLDTPELLAGLTTGCGAKSALWGSPNPSFKSSRILIWCALIWYTLQWTKSCWTYQWTWINILCTLCHHLSWWNNAMNSWS